MWSAGYYHYGISALLKPIASEFGLGRMEASIPSAIGRLEGGIESPASGWITDKFGPRLIAVCGAIVFGLGLILMYTLNAPWSFYLVWGVILGTAYNVACSIPINTAIANWFVRLRGRALGTKMAIAGLSGVVILPIIAWLIDSQGWRMACVIGGLVMLCIPLPLLWFGLKRYRPEYYGLLPDGITAEEKDSDTELTIERGVKYASSFKEVEYTLRQAIKTPAFWMLIITHASHNLANPVVNVHAIPMLTDIGLNPVKAALMVAMMVACSIPFRFIGGVLADRAGKDRMKMVLAGAYLLQAGGFGIFLIFETELSIYFWFILYGIGMGMAFAMNPLMRARYFGRKAFGSINGVTQMLMTPAGMLAPIYAGWIWDNTGNYSQVIIISAVILAVSVLLSLLIIPPKPPVRITDIHQIV